MEPSAATAISSLTVQEIDAFRAVIYDHYRAHGRTLPWRETRDPYAILVSELMLQQTQVERVLEKYRAFLLAFPSCKELAAASLTEVLSLWQGLGYNRRALFLHRLAQEVMGRFGGRVPCDIPLLESLPGIGPYTARAVAAFAQGEATVFIETNIRSVYIHHFFSDRSDVRDAEIVPLIAATLDRADARHWYYALMDYGAHLKRRVANPNRKSAHHVRQSPFNGSNREKRSQILKEILAAPGVTRDALLLALGHDRQDLWRNLAQMEREGFVREEAGGLFIS